MGGQEEFLREPEAQLSDGIDFDNIDFESRGQIDSQGIDFEADKSEGIDFESSGPITFGTDREPGIWPAPELKEKSWVGRAWEGVLKTIKDDEAEKVKSANAVAMAESLGISPSEAYDNLDELSKMVGLKGQPTWQQLVEGVAMGGVVAGLIVNPVATIIGVGTFMGLAEIENALISLQPDEEYEFGAMKGLQELVPEDIGQKAKDLVWAVDMAWKVVVAGGIGKTVTPKIHSGLQSLYTKFVRDVSAKYNLPKDVYISPEKIREFHGRGKEDVISKAESDMLKGLGLTREQYVDALKQGIDVRISAEKIITAVDKPWWSALKRMIGARPYKMEFVKRGEPTIKRHTELLSPPLKSIPKRPVKPSDATPEYEFVSKKGHVYEKVGDTWFGSKGREITNKFVIRAAEEGKVLFGEEGVVDVQIDKVLEGVDRSKIEPSIYRQGRPEGKWWTPDKEYAETFGKKGKKVQEEKLPSNTKLIDEVEFNKLKNEGESVDAALDRLGYDGFTRLEETMEGRQYSSYYLKDRSKIEPSVGEPEIKTIGKHHLKADMIPGRHILLKDKKGNTYESDERIHGLMLEEFKLSPEDMVDRGWIEEDGSVKWLDVPDMKMDLIEPAVPEPTIPPEESQFRQPSEVTKRTLDLLPKYEKIDTPDQLLTRITNEINSELDGKLNAGPTRKLLSDLNNQFKIWAVGEEPPAGIFDEMSFEELKNMSDYLGRLDEWAKQTESVTKGEFGIHEDADGIYVLPKGRKLDTEAVYSEEFFAFAQKVSEGRYELTEINVGKHLRRSGMGTKLFQETARVVEEKGGKLFLEETTEGQTAKGTLLIGDLYKKGIVDRKTRRISSEKPREPDVTLGMGVPIQDLYDKLTTSKKPKKIKLPEKSPVPFTEVKEEARELVRDRRARLDLLNYNVNKFVNKLEYEYSEKQLEAAYFAIEKTKVPKALNRPDLEKVLSKDKKILDDIAKQAKVFHDKQWKEIKKVWPDLTTKQIEDYITHLYDIPKHKRAEAANWFSTFAKSLEPRLIPTMEMAIEKGFMPKTLNVVEIIKINSGVINRAIANTEYIKALLAMEKGGISLIQRSSEAPLNWIEVDYPALTRRIPLPKKAAKKKGEFVKESKVRVHPDLVRPLKVIFEARFDHPVVSAYEAINGVMKKAKLSVSLFHHGALFEVGVAAMGPLKTIDIYFNPVRIYKAMVRGEFNVFAKEPIARDSIEHGMQYGATADIPINRIQGYLNDLAKISKDTLMVNRITSFMKDANSVWDKALWNYLHDTIKLYAYESYVGRLDPKLNAEMTKKAKREITQFVNDTAGGQNWDTLMMTPKEVQMLTWGLLSADWTVSTTRQALALTGIGNVYKETKGLRRAMGWKFWARAGVYFGIGMNLLNVMNRKKDMEENPQYYEDKDYTFMDKTMFGNTMGKKTYLFSGRYEDGTERYVRWGKQFRDFFELVINPLKKVGGKISPVPQLVSEIATGHTLSGFKNDDIYGTEGLEKAKGIIKTIAKSGLPISIIRYLREDMEFKALDIMMQSSKGMSRYSSMEYFKKAIMEGDEEALRDTYVDTLKNNLPAYTLFVSALSWAEAEATASLSETIRDIEDARIGLYTAESVNERKRYGKILGRLNKEKADKSMGLKLFRGAVERARVYKNMELGEGSSRLP